jgi:hypothetical protein
MTFGLSCVKANEKLKALRSELNQYFESSCFSSYFPYFKTHLVLALHRLLKEIG